MTKAVLTVIGRDKVGITAKVSTCLAEANVNILDISQTIMQNIFTMVMLVDISESNKSLDFLSDDLNKISEAMGIKIQLQHVDIFNSMHKI